VRPRHLEQQPRREQQEQHHTNQHRSPVKHRSVFVSMSAAGEYVSAAACRAC
jgi:hypothetical protein